MLHLMHSENTALNSVANNGEQTLNNGPNYKIFKACDFSTID